MSRFINQSKNNGIVYNGFLLPYFVIKTPKTQRARPGEKRFAGVNINKPKTIKITQEISEMILAIDEQRVSTQEELNNQYITPYFTELANEEVVQSNVSRFVEQLDLEFKKDIQEQASLLQYSAQNKLNKSTDAAIKSYQKTVRREHQAIQTTKAATKAARDEALVKAEAEKKAALEQQRKKTRAALRGARAAGKAATAGSISQEEAQELQRDLDGIKQALGSGAYKTLSDGVMKKYLDSQGNVKPNLRPADAVQFKQLIDTENEKLNQPVAAAAPAAQPIPAAAPAAAPAAPSIFAALAARTQQSISSLRGRPPPPPTLSASSSASSASSAGINFNAPSGDDDDYEYQNPDSAIASAAVAPVASNLNLGAGSAAPSPPPSQIPTPLSSAPPSSAPSPLSSASQTPLSSAPPSPGRAGATPPTNVPLVEEDGQKEGMTAEDRSQNLSLQISEQEKGDSGTRADDNLDVSKYGYDKQVSMFAIQEDRDFTYSQTLVKAQNPNPKDGLMEALKMWGYTIEINKPKTNDEAEALEIRTFIFLAKEKYALERQWKRALTQLPEALDDIGFSGQQTATAATGAGQQMGIITQFADPQVFANFVNQAAAAGAGGRQTTTTTTTPAGTPILNRGGTTTPDLLASVSNELRRQQATGTAESKGTDDERRRLTGFGREVGYTSRADRIGRTERIPQGGQGVQRVRVARPQQARPKQPSMRRLDTRPKMNVKEAQFKMRKSRINPNLLFVNLTKQNPDLVGTLPSFKTRASTKPTRRIQF